MLGEITPKLVGKQENKQKIKSKAMRSKQKSPHLWENMDQQNHRQETVLNLNESQQ